MTPGHAEAQSLFLSIGRKLGYESRLTYSQEYPTDGLWMTRGFGPYDDLPIVAIEVVASESPKTWRGSIATLEAVSPSVGLLLQQDEQWRRRLISSGMEAARADARLERTLMQMREEAARSRQRIDVLTMSQLRQLHSFHVERRRSA